MGNKMSMSRKETRDFYTKLKVLESMKKIPGISVNIPSNNYTLRILFTDCDENDRFDSLSLSWCKTFQKENEDRNDLDENDLDENDESDLSYELDESEELDQLDESEELNEFDNPIETAILKNGSLVYINDIYYEDVKLFDNFQDIIHEIIYLRNDIAMKKDKELVYIEDYIPFIKKINNFSNTITESYKCDSCNETNSNNFSNYEKMLYQRYISDINTNTRNINYLNLFLKREKKIPLDCYGENIFIMDKLKNFLIPDININRNICCEKCLDKNQENDKYISLC